MGKNTDKLYITHSEWSSEDAYGASAGANARKPQGPGADFKRLPFNFCALSLQPFEHPVCTADGTIFDLTNILPWLKKHGTNPVSGEALASKDLLKIKFAKNDAEQYVDPVTYKIFTDNTHIVALRNTGNVFAYETIERLNIKAKNWHDLVSDESFKREDIITLQDPMHVTSRDVSSFRYLQDGTSTLTAEQEEERSAGVNTQSLGSAHKILKAREAVAKRRKERDAEATGTSTEQQALAKARKAHSDITSNNVQRAPKAVPYNAARYTTGAAAASFTSTGLTPSTSTEHAILSDEEYMLHPKRVKQRGYARLSTTHGDVTLELYPEHSPKAVWNFVQLAKRGYYKGVAFHRNIKNFMLQGGDPSGSGRGGQSCWGKPFADEFGGGLVHDSRGIVSMANKGKDTNTSQFFITYRAVPHLDRKHTTFGKVVDGLDVLARLEKVGVDDKDRPTEACSIEDIVVYVDPFEEFLKQRQQDDASAARKDEIKREGGAADDRTTWTGKRIRADGKLDSRTEDTGIGKYLKSAGEQHTDDGAVVQDWDQPEPPSKKTKKGGGFGNFDAW